MNKDEARGLDVLRFIETTIRERGYPPSRREISDHSGWTSASTAQRAMESLRDEGLVEFEPGIPRGIRITRSGMVALTDTA